MTDVEYVHPASIWDEAIEIVGSCMTLHEEIVSAEDLVVNAKLREIIAELERRKAGEK